MAGPRESQYLLLAGLLPGRDYGIFQLERTNSNIASEPGERNGVGEEGHRLREADVNQVPRGQEGLDCESDRFRKRQLHGGASFDE